MLNKLYDFVSNQFSNPHGLFGSIVTFMMNKFNKKQYQVILDNINIHENDIVLDIGFGNGFLIEKLLDQKAKKIYGIDISKDMLKKAEKRLNNQIENNQVDLKIANVKDLPYENDFFDKICTINTVYFWDDIEKSFNEISRTLKRNGIFLNAMLSKEWLSKSKFTDSNYNKYTINDIKELIEKSNLEFVDIIELEKNKSYCVISKKI